MQSRVTISLDEEGALEIFVNEAGRDRLVAELLGLDRRNDHFHLSVGELGEFELQSVPYRETDRIVETAKVLFRPDDWDRQHFPHVVRGQN